MNKILRGEDVDRTLSDKDYIKAWDDFVETQRKITVPGLEALNRLLGFGNKNLLCYLFLWGCRYASNIDVESASEADKSIQKMWSNIAERIDSSKDVWIESIENSNAFEQRVLIVIGARELSKLALTLRQGSLN